VNVSGSQHVEHQQNALRKHRQTPPPSGLRPGWITSARSRRGAIGRGPPLTRPQRDSCWNASNSSFPNCGRPDTRLECNAVDELPLIAVPSARVTDSRLRTAHVGINRFSPIGGRTRVRREHGRDCRKNGVANCCREKQRAMRILGFVNEAGKARILPEPLRALSGRRLRQRLAVARAARDTLTGCTTPAAGRRRTGLLLVVARQRDNRVPGRARRG